MILYLLNASLIWLLSLLAYELLFRRETVHHWNRAYLVLTLLLGLLLPMWSWEPQLVTESVSRPDLPLTVVVAHRATNLKAEFAQAVTPKQPALTFSWWMVYASGAAVAFLWTLKDAVRLVCLYRRGERTVYDGYTLVATGQDHSPFSFLNAVFLPKNSSFSEAELQMVLLHERSHGILLHSVDVLFMQVLRIVLWFHPLVYRYSSCLAEVHEYQADAAAANRNKEIYGKLLLSQATGMALPILVHSFHQSPLKNRIAMLVKNPSGTARLLRYIVTVPLVAGCSFLGSKDAAPSNVVMAHGHKIEMGKENEITIPADMIRSKNQESLKMTVYAGAEKLDGEKIYEEKELTTPASYSGNYPSAAEELLARVSPALSALPDGQYMIPVSTPVISKEGQVVYYETSGICPQGYQITGGITAEQLEASLKNRKSIDPSVKKSIDNTLKAALEALSFRPAKLNAKPVAQRMDEQLDFANERQIRIQGGKAQLVKAEFYCL